MTTMIFRNSYDFRSFCFGPQANTTNNIKYTVIIFRKSYDFRSFCFDPQANTTNNTKYNKYNIILEGKFGNPNAKAL